MSQHGNYKEYLEEKQKNQEKSDSWGCAFIAVFLFFLILYIAFVITSRGFA